MTTRVIDSHYPNSLQVQISSHPRVVTSPDQTRPDPPTKSTSRSALKRRHADAILKLASIIINHLPGAHSTRHDCVQATTSQTSTTTLTNTVMSSQIDPQFQYGPTTLPYQSQRGPLPRIDQVHGLPTILPVTPAQHHQPVFHPPPTPSTQRVPTPPGHTTAAPPLPPPHPSPFSHAKETHIDQPTSDRQAYVTTLSLRRCGALETLLLICLSCPGFMVIQMIQSDPVLAKHAVA